MERIPGPGGTSVPVVGVASASAVPGSINHRAGYHLYRIARESDRARIDLQVRGLNDEGAIADLGTVSLA